MEQLKAAGKFDEAHQRAALARAVEMIKRQLSAETKRYLQKSFGDIDTWLAEYVQAAIYDLKRRQPPRGERKQ